MFKEKVDSFPYFYVIGKIIILKMSTIIILNIILPFSYAVSVIFYLADFYFQKKWLYDSKRLLVLITILIHSFYIVLRTIIYDHPQITNKFEIFSLLALSICFIYFVLELITDIRATGWLILAFAFLFQFISSILIEEMYIVPDVLRDRMLGLHVFNAILGYSGFTISAVYGILYLSLYKNLKTKKFGLLFDRLPSLDTLEKLSLYSAIIGFVLLTISIAMGLIWLPEAFPNFSYSDPKLIGTILVWIVYGYGFIKRFVSNWLGKKIIRFSLIGFVIAIASLIITNTLAKTFHSFY